MMMLKRKYNCVRSLAALVVIVILTVPGGVWAQSLEPEFESLTVSLWAEFDRPEVLVIYRGQLSADTELPARLTFSLPGNVQEIHAIAVRQDGTLVNVDSALVESVYEGDDLLLTFAAESREIHFEYYDPEILIRQDQTRAFTYTLAAPYAIGAAALEVQHPFQASNISMIPDPSETRIGGDGLTYSFFEETDLEAGDSLEVAVSYQRDGNELSIDLLQAEPPAQPSQESAELSPTSEVSPYGPFIYVIAGAGVVLLLWLVWEVALRPTFAQRPSQVQTQQSAHRPRRRPSRSTRGREPAASADGTTADSVVSFCHQCGSSLRDDAGFCHRCGAQRRAQ